MIRTLKRALIASWPLLLLALVNLATFLRHYQGRATFPWDFLGGYHAQGFGWFDAGGVFSPPSWLPWSDMGFPAFLAIQSGAWYLPLALLHVAGVAYSVHVATIVQVLHVLFGAVGAYALGRCLGWGKLAALLAGLLYHYSASFYSNQQHVDIVRAAAWIPWLLLSLHPAMLLQRRWGVLLTAFALSQLLIAGYPGNIIAAAYGCAIWVVAQLCGLEARPLRWRYVLSVAVGVTAGVLLAMPKWLPVAMFAGAGLGLERIPPSPLMPHHLFTFIMPFEFDGLSGDTTMRAVWLPLVALWGASFARLRDRNVVIGGVLVLFALFMAMVVPRSELLLNLFPGAWTSRFPVSDWRPVLHLGVILIGVSGWKRLFDGQLPAGRQVTGTLAAMLLTCLVLSAAMRFGYSGAAVPRLLLASMALLVAGLLPQIVVYARRGFWSPAVRWSWLLPVLVLGAAVVDGYSYYRSQPDTWRPGWNEQVELQAFGGTFDGFVAQQRDLRELQRRPARFMLGADPADYLKMRNHSFYNRCWYAHSFCTFGYNNLRLSEPHRHFAEAIAGPQGDRLAVFAARPQQLVVLEPGQADTVEAIGTDGDAAVAGPANGVQVAFNGYASDQIVYRISTPSAKVIVENEIWWPGWEVTLCSAQGCQAPVQTRPSTQYLRSWALPAGTWDVRLHFRGPSMLPAYICLLLGLLLALGMALPMPMSTTGNRGRSCADDATA